MLILARFRGAPAAFALLVVLALGACSPHTLVQRAIEDRSNADIMEDNRIVFEVNKLLAKHETISASTEIYEQRLVVYGLLDDKAALAALRRDVTAIPGIKKLYWHVTYMSESEQEQRDNEILGFAGGLEAKARIEKAWLDAEGVESLNYRVAVDPFGRAYVLGRAKSGQERKTALAVVGTVKNVTQVANYVDVRPE